MNLENVFVYGTLRKGGSNQFRMQGASFLDTGQIQGRIYKIDWYPALVFGGEKTVIGEIYAVSAQHVHELDIFEGIIPGEGQSREYRRVSVEVTLSSGEKNFVWAWEWIGDLSQAKLLDGGDWLAYEPNPS